MRVVVEGVGVGRVCDQLYYPAIYGPKGHDSSGAMYIMFLNLFLPRPVQTVLVGNSRALPSPPEKKMTRKENFKEGQRK